ncbi:hypothetical protein ACMWQD_29300, partial [Escherichia coli]|uniref:hypothetical protein n=1 Tax=Escherichia coli TaxID=562 RepID=UPI0039E19809
TDTAEHSFTKRDQDGQRAPDLLPGSACDFALMFTNVPGDATPNDLVYVLHSYTLEHGYKDFTFRISLKQDSSQ